MDSDGLVKSLMFLLVMCGLTVVPILIVLVAVFFMRRSMSRKPPSNPDDATDTPAAD